MAFQAIKQEGGSDDERSSKRRKIKNEEGSDDDRKIKSESPDPSGAVKKEDTDDDRKPNVESSHQDTPMETSGNDRSPMSPPKIPFTLWSLPAKIWLCVLYEAQGTQGSFWEDIAKDINAMGWETVPRTAEACLSQFYFARDQMYLRYKHVIVAQRGPNSRDGEPSRWGSGPRPEAYTREQRRYAEENKDYALPEKGQIQPPSSETTTTTTGLSSGEHGDNAGDETPRNDRSDRLDEHDGASAKNRES